MENIDRVISLGYSCFVCKFYKEWFLNQARLPFDFSASTHTALINLLNTKFISILEPETIHDRDKFRLGFYGDGFGFTFGHVDEKLVQKAVDKIRRRCKRFLNLPSTCGSKKILFIRERMRNALLENHKFVEKTSHINIQITLIQEYIELYTTLKNFGFLNFELLYLIHSPLNSCNGLLKLNQQEIRNIHKITRNFFILEEQYDFDQNAWGNVRKQIEQRFSIKLSSDELNQPQVQQDLIEHSI